MRRLLWTLLFGGVLLLMLSALVVAPPPEEASGAVHCPAPSDAVLCTLPQTASVSAVTRTVPTVAPRRLEAVRLQAPSPTSIPQSTDANGRVLRAGRYENCVYQVFRAGVAGG